MIEMTLMRKNRLNNLILVACMISFAFVALFSETANASAKHLIVGGLVGAGAVLAWPTIVGGVTALASGAVAVGGAVTGAVAVGGAAVGGAVAGVGTAIGGAVTAGFGAVGGAVAAITASPLFFPALLIAGAVVAGVFIYKHFKDKKAKEAVSPFGPTVSKTSGRITEPAAAADKNAAEPSPAANPALPNKNQTPANKNVSGAAEQAKPQQTYKDDSSKAIKDRYTAAYQNYVRILESDSSNGTSPELMQAFQQLKNAQTEYRDYLDAHPEASK